MRADFVRIERWNNTEKNTHDPYDGHDFSSCKSEDVKSPAPTTVTHEGSVPVRVQCVHKRWNDTPFVTALEKIWFSFPVFYL